MLLWCQFIIVLFIINKIETSSNISIEYGKSYSKLGVVSSPFFFLCHYPRSGEPTDRGLGDVKLTLMTTGAKKFDQGYQPLGIYELLISSNVQLDGFLLTGVHKLTKGLTKSQQIHLPPSSSGTNSAGVICSILNSHISKKPQSTFLTLWMAPPRGTGCVAFLATGSLQDQVLFKDFKMMEVCEIENKIGELKVSTSFLTTDDEEGFVFKDDFQDHKLNSNIWEELQEGELTSKSGVIFNSNHSHLVSKPKDLSRAQRIQYSLGPAGNCKGKSQVKLMMGSVRILNKGKSSSTTSSEDDDPKSTTNVIPTTSNDVSPTISDDVPSANSNDVTTVTPNVSLDISQSPVTLKSVVYAPIKDEPMSSCSYWDEINTMTIPDTLEVHSVTIPRKYRRDEICVKWLSVADISENRCSSLDNVAIVTEDSLKGPIIDDFDPIDTSNWFFFPGGKIQETCGSDGNSLFFDGFHPENWVSTRHFDFSDSNINPSDFILRTDFSASQNTEGWKIEGVLERSCVADGNSITFSDSSRNRTICSPTIDGRSIGVIVLEGGISYCSKVDRVNLNLFVEVEGSKRGIGEVVLNTNRERKTVVLPPEFQQKEIKICLEQKEDKLNNDRTWSLSQIILLPWLPADPHHFFQSQINLKCSYAEVNIDIETSSDGGKNWWSVHQRCLPKNCDQGKSAALNSLTSHGIDSGWSLVTIPLPYIALLSNSRIRIKQLKSDESKWRPSWALDYVFIGECVRGCHGHGLCTADNNCKCEYGYAGDFCQFPDRSNPLYISEPFNGQIETSANILESSGGVPGYQCGVVSSGEAAVFQGRDLRFMTTIDINTTDSHYIQFYFRAGTYSDVGKCPGPNKADEAVFVHYSCSGGSTWHLLKTLNPKKYKEPTHISIPLPVKARDSTCRFQIWQAEHSGSGRDIWAIDDLSVTSKKFNTIELTFENPDQVSDSLRFHLGQIKSLCGRTNTMVFDQSSSNNGLYRFLETKSITVGPSYMMQFDLVIGCDEISFSQGLDSTVVLEYSLNHGLTWQLVQKPCTPSTPGCKTHFTRGTVYHISEYNQWKRATIPLPRHTWSPTTRLRLRQLETSEIGLPWAVDNLYIGHKCLGFCSGHGYCTATGCRCDDDFHGHMCLPLHKLFTEVDADFDSGDDMKKYRFLMIGGTNVSGSEGCGTIVSMNSLYFGVPGIRHFETDDLNAKELYSITFHLVIGGNHGLQKMCLSALPQKYTESIEGLSYGSVVLEYSIDGGISWNLLRELIPSEYRIPKQFSMILKEDILKEATEAAGIIRFRIWQPKHDEVDHWALDNFALKPFQQTSTLQADFSDGSIVASPWLTTTSFTNKRYCESEDKVQVFDSKDPLRKAITNVLALHEGDVIMFQISVGCSEVDSGSPIRLEFSRDGGNSWKLLKEKCLPNSPNCKDPQEPSIYWAVHHSKWNRILIVVDHRLTHGDVQLRWAQENEHEIRSAEFALKDLYIGPPCRFSCHGHGMCTATGLCKCESGFSGKYCGQRKTLNEPWLRDDFESNELKTKFWHDADGAVVSAGCSSDHDDNVLFFSDDNHKFITTTELDTRRVKFLVFDLQIGADNWESRCRKGISPRDDVMLEYSVNNGLSWILMKHFEPRHTNKRTRPFFIALTQGARTRQTKFRWWQTPYHMLEPKSDDQAEWQLDNVMILANETLPLNIAENFTNGLGDQWFMVNGVDAKAKCGKPDDPSLVFSGHRSPRYAETWDFEASSTTIVQFDINPKCDDRKSVTDIHLEYSTNNGKTWSLLQKLCHPPDMSCDVYDLHSVYSASVLTNWTRITVAFPNDLTGERVRLRFRQHIERGETMDPTSGWAVDNIFIGNSCPWMCSGHGQCHSDRCQCDDGYFGKYCSPEKILPCEALDIFNNGLYNSSIWIDIQGAEVSARCGTVVFDTALVFYKEGYRYATTIDLDMTGGKFLQFSLLMGCHHSSKIQDRQFSGELQSNSRSSILIQYSTSGGIIWEDLKNIVFQSVRNPMFISVSLIDFPDLLTNATRFRLWQPTFGGSLDNVWSIDNLFIGGMKIFPNVLYEDFSKNTPTKDAWIDWPAGEMKTMCQTIDESRSSLVVGSGIGEHAIYTRDLSLSEKSVLQFDIRVGCENQTLEEHKISLEFSIDFGLNWAPLRTVRSLYENIPDYSHEVQSPSTYYPNAAKQWERVIIPLQNIQSFCGNVRFRWNQGFYYPKQSSVHWSLDNIYIGPACESHCSGHGYCINGDSCDCDEKYKHSRICFSSEQNDQEILESFDENSFYLNFIRWSGAELSSQCEVLSGPSLLFWQQGERILMSKDLDLVHGSVVQFYMRFQCSNTWERSSNEESQMVLLQYSTDGSISWNLIAELTEQSQSIEELSKTKHFTIFLPDLAKTNATRIRWWEPSNNGRFKSQWAIDQIYIGSTSQGLIHFYDNGIGTEWLLRPGSRVEKACDFENKGVHFSGNDAIRFAETPDIVTSWTTFLQFEISIGCKEINHCYDIVVEYSINHGKTWHLVRESCLPQDTSCPDSWSSSALYSDLYSNLTRVTLSLPKRARSTLARFRFSQSSPWDSHHTWFLGRTYVGDQCPNKCSGNGFCEAGLCRCTDGWIGEQCDERNSTLLTFVGDDFTDNFKSTLWNKIVGAKITNICGPISSGSALHFFGSCNRLLETTGMDLRDALFVQFHFRSGCLDSVDDKLASGNNSVLIQTSCDSGISWRTLKRLSLIYHESEYIWLELPVYARCLGGRVRWWQPYSSNPRPNLQDWALDSVFVGGKQLPPESVTLIKPEDARFPLWLRIYNAKPDKYCEWNTTTQIMESTPSEPAIIQTTDLQISVNHSLHFRLALGCQAQWDNIIAPVSLQYSRNHGRTWNLVRELCLPFNSTSCSDLHDESVFYAPQHWNYYVFPLDNIAPAKYIRFRWIQNETADVMGTHKWSLTDVYIGYSCEVNCLGRGSCINQKCHCNHGYSGTYCQEIVIPNVVYIKDTFSDPKILPHWQHVQGALLAPGCTGDLEEPPTVTFQGFYTRALKSRPIDTRSARFVLFTAQIGSPYGKDVCRKPDQRIHNVFLQYSIDGGIHWNLLRELDYNLYQKPYEDYIILPRHAMTAATTFRFWQPRLEPLPPAWSLDNVFIGGSEIGSYHLIESFDTEPTISEWLFAPHSNNEDNYCDKGNNGSIVWKADNPGERAITSQEMIINEGHILQFQISVGCQQTWSDCNNGPQVHLEFTKSGGTSWDLVLDSCFPETSPDPDCVPYIFHGPSTFSSKVYSKWTRVVIPLPEKTWSSTTQFRWIQKAGKKGHQMERILPWALDDIYIGPSCDRNCNGRGNCIKDRCQCDPGYEGSHCDAQPSRRGPLPTSLIDGFEGGLDANWEIISGGSIGLGCNSLAPYGHGKHLYFSGCGIRQAVTKDIDSRKASKVMFVLRIGSHDGMKSCHVDLSSAKIEDKGVVFQYSPNNGIHWNTLDIHNPLDFRKARRIAYSLPEDARLNGLKLRWWQPDHGGTGTDQWALDNVEIILAQRKATNKYSARNYHDEDL